MMEELEVLDRIRLGEDSNTQFKETINHPNQLEQEFCAFANSSGGLLFIGVRKNGEIAGLTFDDVERINQHISNTSSVHIKPSIAPHTQNIDIGGKVIMIVNISKGMSKPYYTREGIAYVKMGSDKRIAPPEEILRLFQESGAIYADEMPVPNTSATDIDLELYDKFILRKHYQPFAELRLDLEQLLENQQLLKNKQLTLASLLLFSKKRHAIRPQFTVQCIAVYANDLLRNNFIENEPAFEGGLESVYNQTMDFLNRNLRKVADGDSFNSPLKWEIDRQILEEVVVNALVHRDYYVNTTIKVMVFINRVEIISPGKLPNSQNENTIINGVSIPRNPVLQSFAQYVLPYRGLGTGLMRSVSLNPDITFINNVQAQQFKVIIPRTVVGGSGGM